MRLVNLQQGTSEWLEWRTTRCMASEASIIMGVCPDWRTVKTWEDLRTVKAGFGDEDTRNDFMEFAAKRGHQLEDAARSAFYLGKVAGFEAIHFTPAVIERRDGVFAASLDGLNGYGNVGIAWLEAKAPVRGEQSVTWRRLYEGRESGMDRLHPRAGIPDDVWWQLVHQAYVLSDDSPSQIAGQFMVLACLIDDDILSPRNIFRRVPVDPLLECAEDLLEEWERFLSGAAQVPSLGPEYLEAAQRWRMAKGIMDTAEADLKLARNELVAMAEASGREKIKEGGDRHQGKSGRPDQLAGHGEGPGETAGHRR